MTTPPTINVLFMASEADPLIKVGGLGDVAGSLPLSLRNIGSTLTSFPVSLDVRLVLPFHPAIHAEKYSLSQVARFNIHSTNGNIPVDVYELDLGGLTVYLVDGPPIRQETGVYSSNLEADGFKYVFFSLAALELAEKLSWKPDILHANDWHTSAAVYSLALSRPQDPFLSDTTSVLTVHNLPFMGAMTDPGLTAFELPPAKNSSLPAWANHMALPLGLLTADAVVAVSPGYSKEIMTEEFGSGLQIFLRTQAKKITGILNGLDTSRWNPADDEAIAANYTISNLKDRSANKAALQGTMGLDIDPRIPILAMVTRMDPQKGVDLAVEALHDLLQAVPISKTSFQVVFLGTGNPVLERSVLQLAQDYPRHVRTCINYDEKLSRVIYAGADMLLMPSRYEPCGLSQMIAMRYGCVPVARATGGLIDTIQDPEDSDHGTGFLFKQARPDALAGAIKRAIDVYTNLPAEWRKIQLTGMRQDFSWDRSAKEYLNLYLKLLEHHGNA